MDSKQQNGTMQDIATQRWQRKMLPLMRGGLVTLALFFFVASLVQYHLLYQDLRGGSSSTSAQKSLDLLDKNLPEIHRTKFDYIQWKTLVILEQDVIRMRYQQINATLLLRTWTRYTGFLVGMVLALTGAFFILGKLKEDASQLSGESGGFKVMITSSSPGIILAVLGSILMVVTLAVKFDFEVNDRPVYLALYALNAKKEIAPDRRVVLPAKSTIGDMGPPQQVSQDLANAAPVGPDDFPKPPVKAGP